MLRNLTKTSQNSTRIREKSKGLPQARKYGLARGGDLVRVVAVREASMEWWVAPRMEALEGAGRARVGGRHQLPDT